MLALIITVSLAALISALCSTTEAMLYSVPWTHIEKLREQKRPVGELLYQLRIQIDQPISAVLTLNTIANTAGSALAGALATVVLGAENLVWFTVGFTFLILIVGEILPKTFGVMYTAQLATILAYPLKYLIFILKPFILLSSLITGFITKNNSKPETTEEDIRIMAKMSAKSGVIEAFEETVITNILTLDKKFVYDVMTPRTVVFSLPASMPLKEALHSEKIWQFSRIPVYKENNEDIIGILPRRKVAQYMTNLSKEDSKENPDATLESLIEEITFVPETQSLDKTLLAFLGSRQHLFAVLDEYGGLAGVVSMEDVLEEMLGREIIDESDITADLREIAKKNADKKTANN